MLQLNQKLQSCKVKFHFYPKYIFAPKGPNEASIRKIIDSGLESGTVTLAGGI